MGGSRDVRSDAELVGRARAADRQAFAELVRRHRDMAHQLAERLLGDTDLAADASQEACLVAMLSLDRLAIPERFGAWLGGIALNVGRGLLRQRRAYRPDVIADHPDPAPRPDEIAEAADIARRVQRAIGELAPGQRKAVLLFYLEGLSHREVAAELAISVGAVKARLHQARAALAPKLASEVEEEIVVSSSKPPDPTWVDVTVAEVRRKGSDDDPGPCPHVAVLREVGGERELGIWMLEREVLALAWSLEGVEHRRPLTYQFAAGLVGAAGATVREVRITRVADGVFYAETIVEGPDGVREVDSRPSDALNLALVTGSPIRVASDVFEEMRPEHEGWRTYPQRPIYETSD